MEKVTGGCLIVKYQIEKVGLEIEMQIPDMGGR
jgi:hypothetical protein